MVRTQLKFAYSLSMVIAFLLTVESASGLFIADFVRVHALQLCVLPVWGSIQSIVSNLRHALLAIDFCAHLWATESGYLWN